MAGHDRVTKESLVSELRSRGLAEGDVVLFHSSLKAIGRVRPGPTVVIEALLEVIGPDGTLVAPTLIPGQRGIRPYFNRDKDPSEMGLLSELVRKWPGAVRSHHPTHSVAAIGPIAEQITDRHMWGGGPNTPWGSNALGYDTPWDRLREMNAWVLLIGVDFGSCTLLHHAQVRYLDAHGGVTAETPWPDFDFHRMGDRLEREGIVRRGRLGQAECLLARAGEIVETALQVLEAKPDEFFPAGSPVRRWRRVCADIESAGRPKAATFKLDITLRGDDDKRDVVRPIHARGLVIDHPRTGRALLITCDHGAFLNRDAALIRKAASGATGIPYGAITLAATHNHSSCRYHWNEDHREYSEHVARIIAPAASEALDRLEPVRAGWTSIQAPGIRQSRTVYLKDGRAYTERWAIPSSWHVDPGEIAHRGPDDDELRMLVLERLDRTKLAVVANFSCHNSAGLRAGCIQDDFFGVAMELVENAVGGGCVTLVTPGSEGDQDPTAIIRLGGDRDMAYVMKLGTRLAGYMQVAVADVAVHDLFAMGTGHEEVELHIREDWKEVGARSQREEFRDCARTGVMPSEVTTLAIGDYAMVGIPAEIFTTPARRVREHSPFRYTSVMGVTNGDALYVAEREAFFEGSMIYGVIPAGAAIVVPGSDRVLSEAALRALRQAHQAQLRMADRESP